MASRFLWRIEKLDASFQKTEFYPLKPYFEKLGEYGLLGSGVGAPAGALLDSTQIGFFDTIATNADTFADGGAAGLLISFGLLPPSFDIERISDRHGRTDQLREMESKFNGCLNNGAHWLER